MIICSGQSNADGIGFRHAGRDVEGQRAAPVPPGLGLPVQGVLRMGQAVMSAGLLIAVTGVLGQCEQPLCTLTHLELPHRARCRGPDGRFSIFEKTDE